MTENSKNKKLYGLLGRNISYSLSPVMHNAAFKHFNIPAEYVIFDKEPDELKTFFETEVLTGKISGLNVTQPYKLDVKKMLEEQGAKIEGVADLAGSVNTIKVSNDRKLEGYNTDATGFLISLREDAGYVSEQQNGNVFIVGAGGGSRAVCFMLAFTYRDLRNIYVYDMEEEKADDLKTNFQTARTKFTDIPNIVHVIKQVERENIVQNCELIINATPLGTHEGENMPIPLEWLKPGMTVYDLVYARETELVKAAKEKGLNASGGLGMLAAQGAYAFKIWTGTGEDLGKIRNIMWNKALEELAKRKE